ncbi:LADA_0G01332g1_1 [Lachancea dasiensis]|uniref:LADA_0G01332g1_1 n=1 Tax=Lachancea dasiensis TaxID=1072105 RepID=A0A1G4JQW7_9SACH|nr:LADA_0G01332g1_1 [Lachancea dasiensis]
MKLSEVSLCSIYTVVGLLAVCTGAKNVAPLDIMFDPETGKFKRQLPDPAGFSDSNKGLLKVRDARRVSPLNLDELFEESGVVKKRDRSRQKNFVRPDEDSGVDNDKVWDPICLDSRIPSVSEVSIFASYLRDDLTISQLLSNPLENVIVFAPSDIAIESLPMKPWQFPADIDELESGAAKEEEIDKAVSENTLHFAKSHIATGASIERARAMKDCVHNFLVLRSFAFEGDENSGDIMLKKKKGQFYVASSTDKKFQKVQRVEHAQNGIVFVIGRSLISS